MSFLSQLRQAMQQNQYEAILVTHPENRAYLSNFNGTSGWLLITAEHSFLITDFRYYEQAALQAPDFELIRQNESLENTVKELLQQQNITQIGFEQDNLTYAQATSMIRQNPQSVFIPLTGYIENLRMVKTTDELAKMQAATDISERTFLHLLGFLHAGLSEREVALEMERFMREQGADGLAFEIIAASGPRASLPHGQPTDRILQNGDFFTLDFGAKYQGYCSDMTRTVVIGTANQEQKKIYQIVLDAHMQTLAAVKPGLMGKELDQIARAVITKAGYGDYFGHGLGHGVGRNVHEAPSCGKTGNVVLQAGHVITIEPGIYIPQWGGVRIEDMVMVTETGYQNFNHTNKALICLSDSID